jgi:hypothetical protein
MTEASCREVHLALLITENSLETRSAEPVTVWSDKSYLFDTVFHRVSNDCCASLLTNAHRSSYGLGFHGRIPLRLKDMDPRCRNNIEPV